MSISSRKLLGVLYSVRRRNLKLLYIKKGEGHVRFTTVLYKPLFDLKCGRYRRFSCLKSV